MDNVCNYILKCRFFAAQIKTHSKLHTVSFTYRSIYGTSPISLGSSDLAEVSRTWNSLNFNGSNFRKFPLHRKTILTKSDSNNIIPTATIPLEIVLINHSLFIIFFNSSGRRMVSMEATLCAISQKQQRLIPTAGSSRTTLTWKVPTRSTWVLHSRPGNAPRSLPTVNRASKCMRYIRTVPCPVGLQRRKLNQEISLLSRQLMLHTFRHLDRHFK